ncbi:MULTISPECIES: putative type VI secretion system effector [unclassified Photorhabdus]|uniref:putative type VI secretion system effector n=1 Tax=unclassified Photorhabdus TaxID=2620880 RepID=UPI000DCCC7D7|nr:MULTISPECIES: putative type VI secretion system effector [unclassified Photorhabdus]RAW92771.1 hypothetical protein CKY03_22915 [Photorhabdus sp. S9-53]RAW92799.1 hypothetical protein CKY05_22845 [Photorhabdus sp. S10-54]RAW96374.1 hypothetical protein CKY04_22850 [Photorhabdus sp. S8-52]
MNTCQMLKDAIDFKEIKSQRKDIDIVINVNRKHAIEFPDSREEMEKEIMLLQAKIPVLDAILAKEPPPSELPPRKPLIKVSGVLEEFETLCVMGYFTDREYDPEEFACQEERDQFGALLFAMMGNSAAAAATSQTKERRADACHFVRGKINGIPFHGWLGLTTVKIGDYVELAVTEQEEYYAVYALANPETRVISITPRCNKGIRSKAKDEIFYTCYIFLAVIVVSLTAGLFFVKDHFWDGAEILILWCVFFSVSLSPYMYYLSIKKPFPSVKLAQDIFTVLDFPNPENISLEKLTGKRLKAMKSEPLAKGSEDVLPDKYCILSHLYYY